MRKEVLIAIVIGATLGLAVAFGIWQANRSLGPKPQTTPSPTPQVIEEKSELIVTSPEDGAVVSEDKVLVRGAASPNATIVILYNQGEIIAQAQADGSFEQELELSGGANELRVVAYDAEGNKEEKTIAVVYSTEFPE